MVFLRITRMPSGAAAVALGLLLRAPGLHLRLVALRPQLMAPLLVIRGAIRIRTTLWSNTVLRPLLLRRKVMLSGS